MLLVRGAGDLKIKTSRTKMAQQILNVKLETARTFLVKPSYKFALTMEKKDARRHGCKYNPSGHIKPIIHLPHDKNLRLFTIGEN